MDINGWPRHQLRAQGRLRVDPRTGYRKAGVPELVAHAPSRRTDSNDTATRSALLLNFLSKTASHLERELLQNATVPDFALVKNSIKPEIDVNDLVARKRRSMTPDLAIGSNVVAPEVAAEGLLGRLADTIADAAMSLSSVSSLDKTPLDAAGEGQSFVTNYGISQRVEKIEETQSECDFSSDIGYEVEHSLFTPLSMEPASSSSFELNDWFNCLFDPADGDSDLSPAFDDEPPRVSTALLPAALPPVEPTFDTENFETVTPQETARPLSLRHRHNRSRRDRGRLFKRLVIEKPRIASLPAGERLERFDNGAELKKDALGRVRHIRSGLGVSIAIAYDSEGQPQSFVRSDRNGQMHSVGERDRHGVVVRDLEGRVRAAGESMSVDPRGCLSVRRVDGQFWSIDLVKQLHIERRSIVGRDGNWNFLTAVFTSDGFRMMTRFQSLHDDGPAGDRFHWLASEPSGTFRFYGRDGSVIEFEGEDHLTQMKPHHVWAPGSRAIDSNFRGHHQAGTAWDSVQEYVTSYLSA